MLMLWTSMLKFWKYPFTTTVEYKRHSTLAFPSVTICDSDRSIYEPFKKEKFPTTCSTNDFANKSERFKHGCTLFLSGFREGCIFDSGHACSFPSHYSAAPHWNFCYTFNKNGSVKQTVEDKQYGFEVMMLKNESGLRSEEGHSMPPLRHSQLKRGLVLFVHSPLYAIGFNSVDIIHLLPGYYTEVSVKKVVRNRLKAPYSSRCSSKSDARTIFEGNYTVIGCLASCFTLNMYEKCGDVLPPGRVFLPKDKFPKIPKTGNLDKCLFEIYQASGQLGCECPLPCYEEEFVTEVQQTPLRITSTTPRMNKNLARALNLTEDEISLEFYKKNIVRLNLFYKNFMVETIREQPLYDVESLLGDFGGLMGLLIGASTISLIEILWVLGASVFNLIHKKTRVMDNS